MTVGVISTGFNKEAKGLHQEYTRRSGVGKVSGTVWTARQGETETKGQGTSLERKDQKS